MGTVRIPKDRIGVLIGEKGASKQLIEEKTGCKLDIDSTSGEVNIDTEGVEDPLFKLKLDDVIRAVGRGFRPDKALELLKDDVYFELIDIKRYTGKSTSALKRMKGRVIGREGRTRQLIEQLSECYVSVYGHTVALIGLPNEIRVARRAVQMILEGAEHATVYSYLEGKRVEIKRDKLGFF